MSPFEAARKLLSLDSRDLHLGQRADLVFQDSDLVPLLIQVIYMHVKEEWGMKMEMNKDASRSALGKSRRTCGPGLPCMSGQHRVCWCSRIRISCPSSCRNSAAA